MEFTLLSVSEFCIFEEVSSCRNFFQSINMYHRYLELGYETYLVGVKRDDKVVAASLLVALGKTFFGYKIFNAYKGFLLDYNDFELLKFFTKEVKKFLNSKKCMKLYIDPYITNISRDRNGEVVFDDVNNLHVRDYLTDLGYKYLGEREQVKWTYVLEFNNRSKDEIFKSFKSNVRNYINKTKNKYVLNFKEFRCDELDEFRRLTTMSSIKQGFKDKELSYYHSMYNHFGDKVLFLGVELDVVATRNKLLKLNDDSLKGELDRLEGLDDKVMLSVGMFVFYGNEVIYLFSGNDSKYSKYYGSYALQWEIIQRAIDLGYKRYNFFGIKLDDSDGVFTFKKGFNGNVEELLGCFELQINKVSYVYDLLKRIMSTIKG